VGVFFLVLALNIQFYLTFSAGSIFFQWHCKAGQQSRYLQRLVLLGSQVSCQSVKLFLSFLCLQYPVPGPAPDTKQSFGLMTQSGKRKCTL